MTYAEVADVKSRMTRELSAAEETMCETLLEDAAVLIDALGTSASPEAKKMVSCRMVIRALGDGASIGVPIGASQGSMSGLGYSQSWTMGAGGGAGEVYLSKAEKRLLGVGNKIGSYSPVKDLSPEQEA